MATEQDTSKHDAALRPQTPAARRRNPGAGTSARAEERERLREESRARRRARAERPRRGPRARGPTRSRVRRLPERRGPSRRRRPPRRRPALHRRTPAELAEAVDAGRRSGPRGGRRGGETPRSRQRRRPDRTPRRSPAALRPGRPRRLRRRRPAARAPGRPRCPAAPRPRASAPPLLLGLASAVGVVVALAASIGSGGLPGFGGGGLRAKASARVVAPGGWLTLARLPRPRRRHLLLESRSARRAPGTSSPRPPPTDGDFAVRAACSSAPAAIEVRARVPGAGTTNPVRRRPSGRCASPPSATSTSSGAPADPWQGTGRALRSADLAFGNLESRRLHPRRALPEGVQLPRRPGGPRGPAPQLRHRRPQPRQQPRRRLRPAARTVDTVRGVERHGMKAVGAGAEPPARARPAGRPAARPQGRLRRLLRDRPDRVRRRRRATPAPPGPAPTRSRRPCRPPAARPTSSSPPSTGASRSRRSRRPASASWPTWPCAPARRSSSAPTRTRSSPSAARAARSWPTRSATSSSAPSRPRPPPPASSSST